MTDKKLASPSGGKSLNFVSGLALGSAVAAAATFLYKTKKGKQLRRQFQSHAKEAKGHLGCLIKDIKTQAKKFEAELAVANQQQQVQTKMLKKKTSTQIRKTVDTVKKRVFVKSGKPLTS